ncbi:MAG: cyclic nucleotide-binding domain-containing protein [Mesorhizobium sp.]|nr:cyclic nucleotide-binding domain-containing protein [Mesorhizobium sp. M5C.F.Cr.IN.023.01.1.1]RWF88683.1 MAG: cyclic nucleotide-binding domain-containing protein [Mesorhizobium sp.]RWF92925.1 MAG: cyclic nucleotide-binding domain-containing protein [Mesorhizobium sp.]RWI41248.1 MAG: cyclic nucleotide-binding domain-containing protein [Mesorhizobium sp.]RWI49760.1 MAG: cyclic nucleotide-binding domain-containing protein [Mesorhizobium sp.]
MITHTMREIASHEIREPLFPAVMGQPIPFYPSGAEIYAEGEEAGNLFQVQFGCVRVYRLMADGRRQISAFYLSGEVFGFEAEPMHQFFAEAIGGTGVRKIRLTSEIAASPKFLPLALLTMSRAQQHLLVLGRQNAAERVAAFLLDIAERQGGLDHVDLPMSRGDIADYLGLTIETVSRIFTKFRQMGFIGLEGSREVELMNRQALRDMSE